MELKNKTAIVTGATGHLGEAVLTALAQAGCDCICHYHSNKEKGEKIAENLRKMGVKAAAVQADLAEPKQIERLFEEANKLGKPQILVNMASIFNAGKLAEMDMQKARELLDINFTAMLLVSQAFVKNFENEAQGSETIAKIVNFSGAGAIRPWAGYTLYCAAKAAIISATKSLAKELAPAICVNSVAPGLITWPDNFTEDDRKKQLRMIPLKRAGTESEIAEAVVFLAKNDYVTGHVLCVDGGRTI
ncbi:MAG: SDR family oxidoreductase [Phycisphaerae bacterium]|nr:SDR family oxidoreductase [Phycisphaerae bacterium]